MRPRTVAALGIAIAATTCVVLSGFVIRASDRTFEELMTLQVPALLFAYVGAVIVAKRSGNRMGWLVAAVGWFVSSGGLADEYANLMLAESGSPAWPVVLATWYSEWYWIPFVFIAFGLSIMLFPTGRPVSPRWTPFLRVIITVIVVLVVLAALDSRIEPSSGRSIDNPIGLSPRLDPDSEPLNMLLFGGIWAMGIGALASLVQRFRRARGEERQQLKWFSFTAAITVVGFLLIGALDATLQARSAVFDIIVFSGVPVGIGIAILRYRLYDIDIVVNRTIVYLLLSAVLALVYFGGVTLLQSLIGLGEDNQLAVAASTLAVAGLFQPLRSRTQGFIDHYFYRRKYDAQRTIDDFSGKLRDEIDLGSLESELVGVVTRTMQPTHVSVWLPAEDAIR